MTTRPVLVSSLVFTQVILLTKLLLEYEVSIYSQYYQYPKLELFVMYPGTVTFCICSVKQLIALRMWKVAKLYAIN